jgi:oligopeptide/dipeptide ABC transporter ATP-binding protein
MSQAALIDVRDLRREFASKRAGFSNTAQYTVRAVDGVSLHISRGETLALVGESGCGKSTLGRLLMRIIEPTAGSISFDGRPLSGLDRKEFDAVRRRIQFVFQDPNAAFNPLMSVGDIIEEPMLLCGVRAAERRLRVRELLPLVGLAPEHAGRFPSEFSGGQRQRIGIARALALRPELIICDEPVSALDVSIQAQVINLLVELQRGFGLSYLFISHDLRVVRHIADRVAVMYLGRIVETGSKEAIYANPLHPYTRALISAVPLPVVRKRAARSLMQGEIPTAQNIPSGCRFHTRCPMAMPVCSQVDPLPGLAADGREVACHAVETEPVIPFHSNER